MDCPDCKVKMKYRMCTTEWGETEFYKCPLCGMEIDCDDDDYQEEIYG